MPKRRARGNASRDTSRIVRRKEKRDTPQKKKRQDTRFLERFR